MRSFGTREDVDASDGPFIPYMQSARPRLDGTSKDGRIYASAGFRAGLSCQKDGRAV